MMLFARIIVFCFCLATAKEMVWPECKPVETLFLCDLDDIDTGQMLAWMKEVIVQLYAKLSSGSNVKVVLYGARSKEFASSLISNNKYIDVTLGDLISTSSFEKEVTSYFTPNIYRRHAEIVFLITGNNKEYKLPDIMKLKKKLTVIKFGNGRDMEYSEWASSSRHVVHVGNNGTDVAYKDILDLTCQDSQFLCDKDLYREGTSIKCRDCGYICSPTVFRASCNAQCPYLKYVKAIKEDPEPDEAGDESHYKKEDNKRVVIGATLGSIVIVLIGIVAWLLYKKGYLPWLIKKCRPQDGAPTQPAGPDTHPVQETDQPASHETDAKLPLLPSQINLADTPGSAEHSVNSEEVCIPMRDIDTNIHTFSDPIHKIRDRFPPTDLATDVQLPVFGQPCETCVII